MIEYITFLLSIINLILIYCAISNFVNLIKSIITDTVLRTSKYCRQPKKIKKIKIKNNKKK